MDWHKLQHKLFAMDPVDPRAELENLRKLAQKPTEEPTIDLLNESFEIAPGTMPLGIDSISDFAALAGIRLDEKQLKGPAGQARGSDPMPAAKAGRTKHPLKDKLVGEDGFASGFAQGFSNYNSPQAFASGGTGSVPTSYARSQSASPNTKNAPPDISGNVEQIARMLQIRDIQRFSTSVVSASQGNPISNTDKQILGEAFQNLLLLQESKKKEVFRALLGLAPRQASQPTVKNKVAKTKTTAQPTAQPKQQVTSSKSYDTNKTTIKEHLLKLLNEKKK